MPTGSRRSARAGRWAHRAVLAGLLAASAVPGLAASAAAAGTAGCGPVRVLAFRGSGEGPVDDGGTTSDTGGELQNLVDAARGVSYPDGFSPAAVPVEGVAYPAVPADQFSSDPAALAASVAAGVSDGLQAMAGCPGSRFVLLGFSQGMIVAHQLAVAAPAGTVGGVFGIGDPDQEPNARGVSGSGAAGNGMYRSLEAALVPDAFYGLPLDVFTYCHVDDPVCDFSFANLSGSGHNYGGTAAERALLGRALADVLHTVSGSPAATTSSPSGPAASGQATTVHPMTLRLSRRARGTVAGTARTSAGPLPNGTVVTIQGRSTASGAWHTVVRTATRGGAFTATWPAGRTPAHLRAVVAAGTGWAAAAVNVPGVARKR